MFRLRTALAPIAALVLLDCGSRSFLFGGAASDAAPGGGGGASSGTTHGGAASAGAKNGGSAGTKDRGAGDGDGGGGLAESGGEAASVGGGAPECSVPSDCPETGDPCVAPTCDAGVCAFDDLAKGAPLMDDVLGDCRGRACDGAGNAVSVLALEDVPSTSAACRMGSCDASGLPGESLLAAGALCANDAGGKVCDGAGTCVECLIAADCVAGLSCVQHACLSASCNDGSQNGDESDVDCGGSCSPCAVTQACKLDQDCESDACEQLDHVCLPDSCIDQLQDNDETDVDCGGTSCSPCYFGKHCDVDADCTTKACDSLLEVCSGNACADKRVDGYESDVDCGGGNCGPCKVGKICLVNFDCQSGHVCDFTKTPHVCK